MYEQHKLTSDLPIIFHTDLVYKAWSSPHWHENIEILHIIKGSARAVFGNEEIWAKTGDTLIVNSNTIHQVFSVEGDLLYHCLIISVEFLKQMGIDFTETAVKCCVRDDEITRIFSDICELFETKPPYYKPDSCSDALKIAAILMRNYKSDEITSVINKKSAKTEMVKKSIIYMKKNFAKHITLDDISADVGFTKCYFCHAFKEVTGITVVKMLNSIRCQEARRILMNSEGNVIEAAHRSGFTNMSYFTKTYKAIMGQLPSEVKSGEL